MTYLLSQFLDKPEGSVAKFIREAEKLCGYPSEDVRLISDIATRVKDKIGKIGLDPSDTTNQELYYSLRSKAAEDNWNFSRQLGIQNQKQAIDWLEGLATHLSYLPTVFSLKKSVAKKLVSAMPPKNLMKKTAYRSIDSMLKREEISCILALAFEVESNLWKQKFKKNLKQLSAGDFQYRNLEVITMPKTFSRLSSSSINPVYLTGDIILNDQANFKLSPLYSSLRLLDAIEKLESWSAAAENQKFSANFSKFIIENSQNPPFLIVNFSSMPLQYNFLSKQTDLIAELADISPSLNWWRANNYLATQGKHMPVSLNLHDVLGSEIAGAEFKDRKIAKFQESFWRQLFNKYLAYPIFRSEVTQELNPEPALIENPRFEPIESALTAEAI